MESIAQVLFLDPSFFENYDLVNKITKLVVKNHFQLTLSLFFRPKKVLFIINID